MSDFNELIIACKHNLDVSSIKFLAFDIAKRLNINIVYGYMKYNDKFEEEFIVQGNTVQITNEPIRRLFPQNSNNKDVSYFVLELFEVALLISQEIITLEFPASPSYRSLLSEHNLNGLKNSAFGVYITELEKLGATEVYFIEDYNFTKSGISFQDESKYKWDEFIAIIKQHCNYFIEPKKFNYLEFINKTSSSENQKPS